MHLYTNPMPASRIETAPGRVDGIDLLRGLAILLVLLNHVNMRLRIGKIPYGHSLPPQLLSALVWNGQRGVQIFFAVSGFLITSTSLRRWETLGQVRPFRFYRLRFARIAPLLLLLLAVLTALHFAGIENYIVRPKTGGILSALFAALTFHINVLEATRGYLPGNWDILWSLSVEETFYLAFPLFCVLLRRRRYLVPVLFVFVLLGPFARTILARGNGVWQEYSYLGGMDAIALGCLTAILVAARPFSRLILWVFAGCGTAILFSNLAFGYGERTGLDMTLIAVGTCLLITSATQSAWSSPAILKPLAILGQSSYEVYLTHMFVVFTCFGLFLREGKPASLIPALFLGVILLAGLLGYAIAGIYSEPMNRYLRLTKPPLQRSAANP